MKIKALPQQLTIAMAYDDIGSECNKLSNNELMNKYYVLYANLFRI